MTDTKNRHRTEIAELRSKWVGERVRLRNTHDPYTTLEPGAEGTVYGVDDAGTLHVAWDSGSRMGLVPQVDSWELA